MIGLEEAQARLLALGEPLGVEDVALADAAGRWLAADVAARLSNPRWDVSAMDGWAVRHADLPGPLAVVGEAAAGAPFGGTVGPGTTARIFTGAALPAGADTVVVQEDMAAAVAGRVQLMADGPSGVGAHVRRAGQDFRATDAVGRAGDPLTPARLGLLAAAGLGRVPVRRRPLVAVIACGSELVPPGSIPGPDSIISANGVMLAALVETAGATMVGPTDWIVADDEAALNAAFRDAVARADVLVTVGGASVGDHDLVRPVLALLGARLEFWRVAVRPGKPLLAGRLGEAIVLGLPGNPVSALVGAHLFLLPLLRHLAGAARPIPLPMPARAGAALPANGPRRDFQRATLEEGPDGWVATPFPVQDSAMLRLAAQANCLLIRPEHGPALAPGETVPVLTL